MTLRRHRLLLAMALFPPETPLSARLEHLRKHFEPNPGQMSEIDPATLRDRAISARHLGKFGGSIKVKPPKGQCFTITTSRERADLEVCRETQVKWALDDIDTETGTVSWTVKTGPGDFGTPVSWKVPYTIAKVLQPEAEFFKANSTPVYFKSCVASIGDNDVNPRKITLTKFDNSKWVIRFPEKDQRMKTLNENRPEEVWGQNEKPKTEEEKKAEKKAPDAGDAHGGGHGEAPKAEAQGGGHGEAPKEETHGGGHGEAPKEEGHGDGHASTPPPAPEPPKEDLEPWTIDAGRAFEMSV